MTTRTEDFRGVRQVKRLSSAVTTVVNPTRFTPGLCSRKATPINPPYPTQHPPASPAIPYQPIVTMITITYIPHIGPRPNLSKQPILPSTFLQNSPQESQLTRRLTKSLVASSLTPPSGSTYRCTPGSSSHPSIKDRATAAGAPGTRSCILPTTGRSVRACRVPGSGTSRPCSRCCCYSCWNNPVEGDWWRRERWAGMDIYSDHGNLEFQKLR